jgi:hypothetical protein
MSIGRSHRATLRCDRHGCIADLFWQTATYLPGKKIKEFGTRNGWTFTPQGDHFCPEHKPGAGS